MDDDLRILARRIKTIESQASTSVRPTQLDSSTIDLVGGDDETGAPAISIALSDTLDDAVDTTDAVPGIQDLIESNNDTVAAAMLDVAAASAAAVQAGLDGIAAGQLADEKADEALTNAQTALTNADTANSNAQTALDNAEDAQAAASDAASQASDAKNIATGASTAASNAQTAADNAASAAATAKTTADNANTAAANAAGIANGKGKVIYATTAPTGDDRNVNNLWIDTSGSPAKNTPNRWNGSAWVAVTDKAATDAASAAATAQTAANNAQTTANTAKTTADNAATAASNAQTTANQAQTTANGKNKVTYSTTTPGTTANTAGDLWFVISGAQVLSQWQGTGGTSWTQVTLTDTVISTLDAGKITTGVLSADRIGANTIGTTKLIAGSVTTDIIAANAITAAKIAANTITAAQIAANTITSAQIAASTITSAQIAADAITARELAADAVIARNIKAGTVTGDKLVANTVTAAQIATGAITSDKIAANAVTAAKIAAGTITADQIAANAITSAKIAAGAVTASSLSADAINGKTITGSTINGGTINGVTINGSDIIGGLLKTRPASGTTDYLSIINDQITFSGTDSQGNSQDSYAIFGLQQGSTLPDYGITFTGSWGANSSKSWTCVLGATSTVDSAVYDLQARRVNVPNSFTAGTRTNSSGQFGMSVNQRGDVRAESYRDMGTDQTVVPISGNATFNGTIAANSSTTMSITFPNDRFGNPFFTAVPVVTASGNNSRVTIGISTMSATGATFALGNWTSTAVSGLVVRWIAAPSN